MATNKPDSRQTHVTRIFGTNRAGDRLEDIWADVERMDMVKSALQVPPDLQWQGVQRKFRWCDDPSSDDYAPDGTPSRDIEILKVCDPESQDVDDPDEWIPIKVAKAIRQRVETGMADNGGTAMDRFLASVTSDELTTARVIEVRRIVHHDTNYDVIIQAAADADPNLREYVIPSDDYEKDAPSTDEDQYVEHEIITYLKHRGNANEVMGLGRQTKLLNQYLIDESEEATQEITGKNGFNPPYRLDPYQNIINVKFSPDVIVVIIANWYGTPSINATYDLVGGNAELLDTFSVNYQAAGFPGVNNAWAFKVSANAGEFIRVKTPAIPGDALDVGSSNTIYAFVFAVDGDLGASLARARDGARLLVVAVYDQSHSASDAPARIDPPGVLWSIYTGASSSEVVPFKIRFGKHRNDRLPLNAMVQLYPLQSRHNISTTISISGYYIMVYRLDRKGTGAAYAVGAPNEDPFTFPAPGAAADPAWQQIVDSLLLQRGIPFADPPPLISVDHPSLFGGLIPPYGP